MRQTAESYNTHTYQTLPRGVVHPHPAVYKVREGDGIG